MADFSEFLDALKQGIKAYSKESLNVFLDELEDSTKDLIEENWDDYLCIMGCVLAIEHLEGLLRDLNPPLSRIYPLFIYFRNTSPLPGQAWGYIINCCLGEAVRFPNWRARS